jgi:hypothetical protein
MNELTYRTSAENGLTFDLIVDGKPLPQLAEGHYAGIPYWIIENDLPNWEPEPPCKQDCDRVVSVCECGEYGCGHTRCRIEKSSENRPEYLGRNSPSITHRQQREALPPPDDLAGFFGEPGEWT